MIIIIIIINVITVIPNLDSERKYSSLRQSINHKYFSKFITKVGCRFIEGFLFFFFSRSAETKRRLLLQNLSTYGFS